MKKCWKITLVSLAIIIALLFANGCYYVFNGQHKSMKKLQQGKELNLYECCSIYSMHTMMWIFGWPINIEAAKEAFWLQFGNGADKWITNDNFAHSKYLQSLPEYQNKETFKVLWPKDDYKYSLAYNSPNTIISFNDNGEPSLTMRVAYTDVEYNICGIDFNTALFSYLQEKDWLHPYNLFVANYFFFME